MPLPIEQEIKSKSIEVLTESKKYLIIKSPENYSAAANFLKQICGVQDVIKEFFAPMLEKAKTAKKAATESLKSIEEQKSKHYDPLENMRDQIKHAMLNYNNEQTRIAQAKREKAEADARAEEDAKRKKLEAEAKKAQKKGDTEKAEELREKAENVFVPTKEVESVVPKINGVVTKETWKFRIVDSRLVPLEYWIIDETKIGQVVRATKGTLNIPGIEIYSEKNISA